MVRQRVYGAEDFGAGRERERSFVIVSVDGESYNLVCVVKDLFLVQMSIIKKGEYLDEYVFLQYMESMRPVDVVDAVLRYKCL